MSNEFKEIKQIAQNKVTFWVSFALISTEAFYTYTLLRMTSPVTGAAGIIQAAVIAFFIDLSVLMFTIRGKHAFARLYMVLMLLNIIIVQVGFDWQPLKWLAVVLLAFEIAGAVYLMSFITIETPPAQVHHCECGRSFDSQQGLAGHKRTCNTKKINIKAA